jgi:hypothetical protein
MILTIAPLLGASLIAASLTVDEFHNWVGRLVSVPNCGKRLAVGDKRAKRAGQGTADAIVLFVTFTVLSLLKPDDLPSCGTRRR